MNLKLYSVADIILLGVGVMSACLMTINYDGLLGIGGGIAILLMTLRLVLPHDDLRPGVRLGVLLILAGGLILGTTVDIWTTIVGMESGVMREANPLAVLAMDTMGIRLGTIAIKLATTLFVIFVSTQLSDENGWGEFPTASLSMLSALVAVGLLASLNNLIRMSYAGLL